VAKQIFLPNGVRDIEEDMVNFGSHKAHLPVPFKKTADKSFSGKSHVVSQASGGAMSVHGKTTP
jgi:hypothetical protein